MKHQIPEAKDRCYLAYEPSAQECILVHHKQGRQILVSKCGIIAQSTIWWKLNAIL